MILIAPDYTLVNCLVIYYLPDYRHLVNELFFQTVDQRPKYPRIDRFLTFWRVNIDAVIKDVLITDADQGTFTYTKTEFRIH